MPQQQQTGGGRRNPEQKAALQQSNLKTLREMFTKMSKQLEAALPRFITAERMIRVATTTVQRNPRLLECDPITLIGAVMQSAQLGLEPDNITGAAYLVPFWNSKADRLECTLIPGYRGLMMLARRTKEIQTFDAHVVKKGDLFEFEYGSRQFLKHKPATLAGSPDEVETVGAYMIAFYNGANGNDRPCQFFVMQNAELEKAKQFTTSRVRFGPNKGEITGPWIEHPDAMKQKTVIRRGAKLLPFSIELLTAVSLEDRAIAGRSQNLGALAADALDVDFRVTDDDDDATPEAIDPALTARLDAGFNALQYSEARRTVKMAEYRGKLPDLVEWLEAEGKKKPTEREPEPKGEAAETHAAPAETIAPKVETKAATPAPAPPARKASKLRI